MVGTEGTDWKKHCAVTKLAFNEVGGERTKTYNTQVSVIDYPHCLQTGKQHTSMVGDYPNC